MLLGDVAGINLRFTSVNELTPKYGYMTSRNYVTAEGVAVAQNSVQVFAFRVAVHELTPRRLVLHQSYVLFYGTARIVCILAWRFPAESSERTSDHMIMVPLTHYPVTCYAPSDTQKNLHGKVLVVINGTCAALGRIDRVMQGPNPYAAPTRQGNAMSAAISANSVGRLRGTVRAALHAPRSAVFSERASTARTICGARETQWHSSDTDQQSPLTVHQWRQ